MALKTKEEKRQRRHLRVRKRVVGTAERPRLCVFRSEKHIYAQVIDDTLRRTLVSASSVEPWFEEMKTSGGNVKGAAQVGKVLAERAVERGLKKVVSTVADISTTEGLRRCGSRQRGRSGF